MLKELTISNYALIDYLKVDLTQGFTSITGETGAGKSILLGGLSLALGKRADLNLVKDKIVSIKKELNLETFDIESDKYANKLQLEKKILKNRKQMNKFISNNLIADKKTGHMNQMKRFMGELS